MIDKNYVCANCGMLIEDEQRHTKKACVTYGRDPTKPDKRLTRFMTEKRGARETYLIKAPNYQSSPTTTNHDQPPKHEHSSPIDPDVCPTCGSGHSCDCSPHDHAEQHRIKYPHTSHSSTPMAKRDEDG